MLQHAMEINDKSAVKKLEKIDKDAPDFPSIDYISTVRSQLMNKYGIGIIQGKYDYQVSYTLAREYLETIEAPDKAFFTFEESAHSPNAEEPEKFVQIVRQITLQSKN
jgi:esterase/lipase